MEEKKSVNQISTFQLVIIIFIFVILMVIGFMIKDYNLKISYYLSVVLGIFTIINIYLTITYYLDLRVRQGEKGPKGPKGDRGPKGDGGSCVFSTKCNNNENCEENIYKSIHDNLVDIDANLEGVSMECIKNPSKQNCKGKSDEVIEKVNNLNKLSKELIDECQTTRIPEKDFLERVSKGLENLN